MRICFLSFPFPCCFARSFSAASFTRSPHMMFKFGSTTNNTFIKPNRPSSFFLRYMMSAVLRIGHQLKIAESVVRTVMIFVMHNFIFSKFSSKVFFHYHSVLHRIFVITNLFCKRDENTNISMIYKRLFLGIHRNPNSVTFSGARLFSVSVTRYISKWFTTNFAFKHRHLLSRYCTITWSLLEI